MLVVVATLAGCSDSEPSTRGGDLLRFRVSGDRVDADQFVAEYFAGDARPSDAAMFAAACHNVTDWLGDVTLDNDIAINQSDHFIRMAELVATRQASEELVKSIELQVWLGGDPTFLNPSLRSAGFTAEDLAEYVDAVAEAPSPEAKDRYVVYAVSRHVDLLEFVAFDVTAQGDESFASRATMTIHLFDEQGEQTELPVPDEECQA